MISEASDGVRGLIGTSIFVLAALLVPGSVHAANMQITGQAWSSGLATPFMGWIEFGAPYYDYNNDGVVTTGNTAGTDYYFLAQVAVG